MAINRKQVKFLEVAYELQSTKEKVVKALNVEDYYGDIWDSDIEEIEQAKTIDEVINALESLDIWSSREAIVSWVASLPTPALR